MNKVIPFSNATEASWWLTDNCEQCRRSGCTKKVSIDRGWLSGYVTQKVADYVGDFNSQCIYFSSVRITQIRNPKPELTPNLF